MTQSLSFSHILTFTGTTVSSNFSYPVLGCFAALLTPPNFSWGQLTSVFPKPSGAHETQEWLNEWMTWWLRGGSLKGPWYLPDLHYAIFSSPQEDIYCPVRVCLQNCFSPTPQRWRSLKKTPIHIIKENYISVLCCPLHLHRDWHDPALLPKDNCRGLASCLSKGPSWWIFQDENEESSKSVEHLLLEMETASIPPSHSPPLASSIAFSH